MKTKRKINTTINKKVLNFIDNNFYGYTGVKIEEEKDNNYIALLDYGKVQPKMRIKFTKTQDTFNLYKLVDTQFIY